MKSAYHFELLSGMFCTMKLGIFFVQSASINLNANLLTPESFHKKEPSISYEIKSQNSDIRLFFVFFKIFNFYFSLSNAA